MIAGGASATRPTNVLLEEQIELADRQRDRIRVIVAPQRRKPATLEALRIQTSAGSVGETGCGEFLLMMGASTRPDNALNR
jgi:hypothetical protein